MNQNFMKAPGISELYSRKLIQTAHLKKLENIRQNRKTQLSIDKNRSHLISSILRQKAATFQTHFNNEHQQISKFNVSLIKKIGSVKPSSVCQQRRNNTEQKMTNLSSRSRVSLKSQQKQKQKQKQNLRLFVKLRAVSSNLKSSKFRRQHEQTQKIKNRLMRYSYNIEDRRQVGLKSQRYLSMKSSYLSNSIAAKTKKDTISMQIKPKSTAQHYKKQDIVKNTISKISKRYNTLSNVLTSVNVSQHNQRQKNQRQHNQRQNNQNQEETFLTKPLSLKNQNKKSDKNAISLIKYNKNTIPFVRQKKGLNGIEQNNRSVFKQSKLSRIPQTQRQMKKQLPTPESPNRLIYRNKVKSFMS